MEEPDDRIEEDGPLFPWLHPDDRLWRHPSELASHPTMVSAPITFATRESDRRLWAVALLAGVVGALLASGTGVLAGSFDHSTTVVRPFERVVDPSTPYLTVASGPKYPDVVRIAEQLRPAIVELIVNGSGATGNGSGVIFRSDGYVLTNQHLVEGAQTVEAILSDGHRVKCRIVGTDPATDIAVIKLLDGGNKSVAVLGSSASLKVGQLAVAIGSTLGMAGPSVTSGIVSAVGHEIESLTGDQLLGMIQTDAAIAPGSSGGALVDSAGNVVGITTAMAAGELSPQGVGLATPIEVARTVATQLLTTGKATHVWLGVQGADVDGPVADSLGVTGGAVLVQNVDSNSPAAKAGITTADVVTAMGGRPVGSVGALEIAVDGRRPGERISISLMRDGRPRTIDAVLVERPRTTHP